MCNSIDNSTLPPSPFCLMCCQRPFCCKEGKTTGFTFFLQAPFPPGTASHSLLMASLIGGVRKCQKSESVTQILQVYVVEPKKKSHRLNMMTSFVSPPQAVVKGHGSVTAQRSRKAFQQVCTFKMKSVWLGW